MKVSGYLIELTYMHGTVREEEIEDREQAMALLAEYARDVSYRSGRLYARHQSGNKLINSF